MINLHIDEYCEYCPEFDADVEKVELIGNNISLSCNTDIFCTKRHACAHIRKYIENTVRKEMKKGEY